MSGPRILVADALCARAAGSEAVATALRATYPAAEVVPTGCDGRCWAQPVVAVAGMDADGALRRYERVTVAECAGLLDRQPAAGDPYAGQTRRVLRRCGVVDPDSLADVRRHGGYAAWERARTLPPADLIALIKEAALRGRGGAYFPQAIKLESVRAHAAPRYLVVNAEEGEPGVFKDRHLMEGDPHLLVEGIAIAAHAAGAEAVYVYINGQARLAHERVTRALAEATAAGLLDPAVRVEVYQGAGGYVCGEESVILNSIEGERAVPRTRPPLPVEAGLFGRPTAINNVETLCNMPAIVLDGAQAFRSAGDAAYPGTKLFSVSGAVQRPGLYELPIGVTAGAVLAAAGGPPPGATVHAVVMGGPSGGFLTPAQFDLPLLGGLVHPTGAVLGAGGVVALDERAPPFEALREVTAYNTAESCGKCTPCREGSARALAILDRAGAVGALSEQDRADLLELCDVLQYASLCGLGQMAPGPIRSAFALGS
jgi:NADH-quinone oxidoreductase subunit F